MNDKEMRKAFDREWKETHQTQYVLWLIFYVGSLAPLLIGLIPLLTQGTDDKTVTGAIVGLVIFAAMECVALALNVQRARAWKEYKKTHGGKM